MHELRRRLDRPPTCTGSLGRGGTAVVAEVASSPPETKSPTGTPVGDAPKSSAPGSTGSTIGSGWIPSGGDSGTGIAVDGATSACCGRTAGGAGISGLTMMNSRRSSRFGKFFRRQGRDDDHRAHGDRVRDDREDERVLPHRPPITRRTRVNSRFPTSNSQLWELGVGSWRLMRSSATKKPSPARAFTPFDTGGTMRFPLYFLPSSP